MNVWSLPPLMMASIIFYVGAYHFILFFRQPRERVNLSFALCCFSVVLYQIFCAGLYSADTNANGIAWQRAQFASLPLMTTAFAWFFSDFTTIISRRFLVIVSLFSGLFFVLAVTDPSLSVQSGAMATKNVQLPFGVNATYREGELGPVAYGLILIVNISFLYLLVRIIQFIRQGGRNKPRILTIALIAFFAGSFNDSLVAMGYYDFIYTLEYSYLAIVLVMAFSLSEKIVQAALTKEALRESEERLGMVLVGADLATWDWNLVTNEVVFNERWLEMMGFSSDRLECDVADWEAAVHPEDRSPRDIALQQHFAGETNLYKYEYRIATQSGEWKWLLDRGKIVEGTPGGKLLRAAGTILDITQNKFAMEERIRLESQLLQSQKLESIGRLSAGIAHDLNNMLAPILCLSDLIAEDLGDDHPQTQDLRDIRAAANRAKELTQQLLAYSRKQVLQVVVVELNTVIKDLGTFLRRLIPENIGIELKLSAIHGRTEVDPTQIEQILMNLVVNARDAIRGHGTITVGTADVELPTEVSGIPTPVTPGPYVMLMVEDTGQGIDNDQIDQIFEPFFTTKEPGRGTGLGLATVYGIVKQHRGYIAIDSTPQKGTTLTIYLPRSSALISSVPEKQHIAHSPAVDASILIVEDDTEVRKVAVRILSRIGYSVLEASRGLEAIELFRKRSEPPRLLLTDVIMPEMNGLELYQSLSGYEPDLKVLYMSGYADILTEEHGIITYDTPLLRKPFTVDTLTAKVKEVLLD